MFRPRLGLWHLILIKLFTHTYQKMPKLHFHNRHNVVLLQMIYFLIFSRDYLSTTYLDYVSKMTAVDSKLDQVLLSMLEFQEIEEIVTTKDHFINVLTPLQLLGMLSKIVAQSNQVPKVCSKIWLRFQTEILSINARKLDNQICKDDLYFIFTGLDSCSLNLFL